jgi:hypothetical protein
MFANAHANTMAPMIAIPFMICALCIRRFSEGNHKDRATSPEGARFVTFQLQGNGNVTAGAVAIECCPQTTPTPPSAGSVDGMAWITLTTPLPVSNTSHLRALISSSRLGR